MDRNLYIGSSDASEILSGDWFRLFQIKTGRAAAEDLSDNFKVQLGAHVEPFHLDWTIRRLNAERGGTYRWAKSQDTGEQFFAQFTPSDTQNSPLLGSHPDAVLKDGMGPIIPVEVKHTGRFRNADEAADYYMPQIQHHIICWGVPNLLFSVICGNEEPERIWIGYSQAWADHYIERCDRFWAYLKADVPPNPAMLQEKIPTAVKDSVPLNGMKKRSLEGNNYAESLIPEFIVTQKVAKRHEEVKKELKEMMAKDESELYHPALVLKRNRAGSILITVKDENYGQTQEAAE